MNKIVIFTFLLLSMSCQKKDNSKLVFILFDLSGSTKVEKVREKYFNNFQKIFEEIKGGDRLIIDFISENPLAQASFPVNYQLEKKDFLDENIIMDTKKRLYLQQEIDSVVHKILFDSTRKVMTTKIFEATQLAERIFKKYPYPDKYLILFSDMVQESDNYNFVKQNLTSDNRKKIIDQLRKEGNIPKLPMVNVYVIGAASGVFNKLSRNKYNQIRNFWIEYFNECGATLKPENYGGPFLGF